MRPCLMSWLADASAVTRRAPPRRRAALTCRVMPRETVAVVGAEQLLLSKAVRRVASVVGRRVVVVPWPVWAQYALAQMTEWTMKVPLVAKAQVRMLAEGVTDAAPPAASVPDDLRPRRRFTAEQIRQRLLEAGGFGWKDLRVNRSA